MTHRDHSEMSILDGMGCALPCQPADYDFFLARAVVKIGWISIKTASVIPFRATVRT